MLKHLCLVILAIILCNCSHYHGRLRPKIDHLIAKEASHTSIAVEVRRVTDGKILYQRSPHLLMTPASNIKLLTAYAALSHLGSEFRFITEVRTDKSKINKAGNLNDNLYLKFSGDPTLTLEELELLISQIKKHKIKTIQGKLIIDDSALDQYYLGKGWAWDDSNLCMSAPVSAIVINHNCFNMLLEPNSHIGYKTYISNTAPYFAHISNESITVANKQKCNLELTSTKDNKYSLSGCVNHHAKPLKLNIAYQDPRQYAKTVIRSLLKKHNIHANHAIEFGSLPRGYDLLANHISPPIVSIVTKMLKDSDNLYADNLIKVIGTNHFREQGSFMNGIAAMHSLLEQELHLPANAVRVVDGSGLSRYNLVSPAYFTEFLQAIHHYKPIIYKHMLHSLPILGSDGTLKNRSAQLHPETSKVYAKTGSMSSVSTLSGYIESKTQGLLVFSIMVNGFLDSKQKYHDLQDKITAILAQ